MDFIIGGLLGIVLFLLFFFTFKLGQRTTKKPNKTPLVNDEEKRKIEQFNKHFKALFAYDVEKALERKKVT